MSNTDPKLSYLTVEYKDGSREVIKGVEYWGPEDPGVYGVWKIDGTTTRIFAGDINIIDENYEATPE